MTNNILTLSTSFTLKFTPLSKYRARHKKKPINDKINVVNPKDTPTAMLSCVPRSPTKKKKMQQISKIWKSRSTIF